MPKSAKCLLIGSSESYSGKSAIILGMAHQLQERGLDITYGKPIGTCLSESQADDLDEDVRLMRQVLGLPEERIVPPALMLDRTTISDRLRGSDTTDYGIKLQHAMQTVGGDLVLLEGAGTFDEGHLFGLALPELAQTTDAAVVLVARFHSDLIVDGLLTAKQRLGDRLLGVLINDVPEPALETITAQVQPFLQRHDIEVFGVLPSHDLLRSVSVAEIVHQLEAEVLCRADRLELMVESLKIGAMNVNSALEYFRKGRNMAIVTGGDRSDIQLAALETSTQCLILTGRTSPTPAILNRAEEMEIPILSVDLDTLTTVELIDRAFGQVRLHEPIKIQTICQLMAEHFDIDRLLAKLGMEPVATL